MNPLCEAWNPVIAVIAVPAKDQGTLHPLASVSCSLISEITLWTTNPLYIRISVFSRADVAGLDIYDLKAVNKLQTAPEETFFSKYARGDWKSLHPMEIPLDIAAEMPEMPVRSTRSSHRRHGEIGHAGELDSFSPGTASNHDKGTSIHMDSGPPDLMQSVEDVYRSFISDGHRTSHSNLLPTPHSEVGGFHFSGSEWEKRGRRASVHVPSPIIIAPDGYAAHHAKRFAELGYCQSFRFLLFMC
jgi:hypothetical protein